MGLKRIDKLHLLTRAYIKPTQGGYCVVGALLVLGCRNPSFGLVTKAKGLQGCRPRGSLGVTS
jgi:hypothetical protein